MAATVTATITQLITVASRASSASSASPSASNRATPQGGVIEGSNPSHYDPKNPIVIFIIQAGIIIIFCRLLHWPLSKLRQPRVIAEVIGGILLGPSVMGRIPGFTKAIFPTESIPNLNLVANLGLVLFLFLVGLEVDLRFLVKNWKIALSVGAAGMALPFGLGAAIAWGLYHNFHDDPTTVPISFGVYLLFIGVAMAITAFPVLCRILTELKLLSTSVGIIVLSAGVGNDVIGWVLLALCVALTNAGTGLSALYILLACIGFTLFLVFAVRPVFLWILRRSGALQDGPSQSIVALTLMIALTSSFFTAIIGVHAIFGAFLAGLICPHEGGFAIKVTEKIEDLISALFLPLYFALSGLSTDLGLLNDGKTWGYVVGVIACAFFGKVIGGSGAARLNGLVWRECFTIGALMSCKGLVELIVLNIGLQAPILSTRTFTMFVVMALVTTFATTPLVSALYPPWYQQKLEPWKRGEIDWATGLRRSSTVDPTAVSDASLTVDNPRIRKILLHLRLDSMPGLLSLMSLCGGSNLASSTRRSSTEKPRLSLPSEPMTAHGLRLVHLTERDSSVMRVSEVDEFSALDPVVNTLRAFGALHHIAISGEVAIIPEQSFADILASRTRDTAADLLILPWSATGGMSEAHTLPSTDDKSKLANSAYHTFISAALELTSAHVAVLIDSHAPDPSPPRRLTRAVSEYSIPRTVPAPSLLPSSQRNLLLSYHGTEDDEVALVFALQLAHDPSVQLRIGDFSRRIDSGVSKAEAARATLTSSVASRVTVTLFSRGSENGGVSKAEAALKLLNEAGTHNGSDLLLVGRNADPSVEGESALGAAADAIVEGRSGCSLLVLRCGKAS